MLATVPKKALDCDRGVVPVSYELAVGLLTKPVRATPDGRLDVLDFISNAMTTRNAGVQALNAILEKVSPLDVQLTSSGEGGQIGTNPIAFGPEAFSRVRWAGAKGAHDSLVAKENVCIAIMAALKTVAGAEIRSALATQLARAMQAKAGLTNEEIQAVEQPTTNPQLTNAMAAAVGAPVLPEMVPTDHVVTTGDTTVTTGATNVTIHAAPRAPSDDGQGSGTALQTVSTDRLIELAVQPEGQLQPFAMRMLDRVERSAEAQTRKQEVELKKCELEVDLLEQRKEHTETDHKRKVEQEVASSARKVQHTRVVDMAVVIAATHKTAVDNKMMTPRLRHELSEQLTANLAGAGNEATTTAHGAIHIPKIFTAKAYAEHLRGAPLTDAKEITKLRSVAAQIFHHTFKQPATCVLPQEREGMACVAQFKESDLQHRAFHNLFVPYRSTH